MLYNETRALLIQAWNKTHNAKEIAECFSVHTSTVYNAVSYTVKNRYLRRHFLPFVHRIVRDGFVRVLMCNNLLDCYKKTRFYSFMRRAYLLTIFFAK